LVNFRLKAIRILANKSLESHQTSVTRTEESFLLSPDTLPEYYNSSFLLSDPLVKDAELKPTDIEQIDTYLHSLADKDPSSSTAGYECE
jgi:hypothetical protein